MLAFSPLFHVVATVAGSRVFLRHCIPCPFVGYFVASSYPLFSAQDRRESVEPDRNRIPTPSEEDLINMASL